MSTSRPPKALPRKLVIASAGSGKTYHLASCFIQLLAAGVPHSEILASTFTRRAAGEILERVLVRLAESAIDAEKARTLSQDTRNEVLGNSSACRTLLARVLIDLHQMNVSTLDAFFIRVARSFSHELGLAPGWTISDDVAKDQLRTEAVQTVLAESDTSEWTGLLRRLNKGSVNRAIHKDLLRRIDELLLIHRQLDPNTEDHWIPDLGVRRRSRDANLQKKAEDLADRLRSLDVPFTQKDPPEPDKRWEKARDRGATNIAALEWADVFSQGIGAKVIAEDGLYYSTLIDEDFIEIFETAKSLAQADLSPKFRRQGKAMGRLAELLQTGFEEVQSRMCAYRFEDIPYLLGKLDLAGSQDHLHYRLDQKIRHILIDEFQDTSLLQWRALSPVADELLSGHLEERAGVIIADPKQSIYGWRGACPELAHQVGEKYALTPTSMTKSWRSSSEILDFVAKVFDKEKMPTNKIIGQFDVGSKVVSDWLKDFTEIQPAKDSPGHVCIHLTQSDRGASSIQPKVLRRAAEVVKDLQGKMPTRSIGVLVRENKVLSYIMDELQDLGVDASGEGGTSLTDTPPVNALLSLLKLADHPLNSAARYHVACSPVSEVVRFRDYTDDGAARDLANQVRSGLVTDGYGPTLAGWVQDLAHRCDKREVQRLLQLVELGYRWDDRATLRPSDFVRYVAGESMQDPSSANVQVMTVHNSKGGEFDAVVLPDLYHPLSPKANRVAIPERDSKTGPVVRVYPLVNKDLRALFPTVEGPYREQEAMNLRDQLSVLYVALTRARYALHLVLPPEGGRAKNSARLIRDALDLDDTSADDNDVLWESGNSRWFKEFGDESDSTGVLNQKKSPKRQDSLLRPSTKKPGRNLARRSPSSLEGASNVDLSLHLKLDAGPARQRGSAVHAWLEKIQWIEDGVPDDHALHALAGNVAPGIRGEDLTALVRTFQGWMEIEEVRRSLSRNAYNAVPGTEPRVENEMPFVRHVDGEIQEGFIDRLVLIERDGQVVGAEVLDFKTDEIKPGDGGTLADRREYYRPQITAYCDFVQEQYGLSEDAVDGKLVFLGAGVISKVV